MTDVKWAEKNNLEQYCFTIERGEAEIWKGRVAVNW